MPKLYEALAEAFLAEGVDTQFVLLGDGNMHWSTVFAKLPGVHTVHVRHEHCTVAAATAYNVATGKVAVASVTCGPGVTQVMTALPAAVRARLGPPLLGLSSRTHVVIIPPQHLWNPPPAPAGLSGENYA
jgi:acetolactate synthase-1/2/3 large subunit